MATRDRFQSEQITLALHEDKLTALLHDLLTTSPPADGVLGESPAGVDLLRSLLSCGGRLRIPVLDLVAVLPNADFRDLEGLHIASYYGCDADDRWYWRVLEDFFATGKGSLLALERVKDYTGKCPFFLKAAKQATGTK